MGPGFELGPGQEKEVEWVVPPCAGRPIYEVGLMLERGPVLVDFLTWDGIPTTEFPPLDGTMWARAWAKSLDRFEYVRDQYEMLSHNEGVGLLTQGCREWQDYRLEARLTPKMALAAGLAISGPPQVLFAGLRRAGRNSP